MPRLETRNTFFGENMEYFNGQEWKYIKDYKRGEKVLTYFPKDKHVELLLPLNYIKRKLKQAILILSLSLCVLLPIYI